MRTAILLGVFLISCGDNTRDVAALRTAVGEAKVTMREMVAVAEAAMPDGRAITAELVVAGTPVYAYGTAGGGSLHDIRIDTIGGAIVANRPAGTVTNGCSGSIPLAEALRIAEAQVTGGTAIAAVPDDDVKCAREIQVLGALVMEVKVGGAGEVLEVEVSDEYGDQDSDSDSDSEDSDSD